MASLIEELISTLEEENSLYEELIPVAQSKTRIIIKNDLEELQRITQQEQDFVDRINVLEHKREEIVSNVGVVLSRKPEELTLKEIILILKKQPKEQQCLSRLRDSLRQNIGMLTRINGQNKVLIDESLEIIEFNMNLIQSTRMSPGNNYDKGAQTTNVPLVSNGRFDAKQ